MHASTSAVSNVPKLAFAHRDADRVVDRAFALPVEPETSVGARRAARLALLELSRGTDAAMLATDRDLEADLYVWANRRERAYAGFAPMGFRADRPSVLRWYGARAERRDGCSECGEAGASAGVVFEAYAGPG